MTPPYLHIGDHVEHLASGRRIEPGEEVPADAVNAEDAGDQRLLAESVLVQSGRAGDPPSLESLPRAELDARAQALGVENPDKLPNKDAVVAAIRDKESNQ